MSSLVVTFVLSFYVFGFMFVCTGRLFYLNWCQILSHSKTWHFKSENISFYSLLKRNALTSLVMYKLFDTDCVSKHVDVTV